MERGRRHGEIMTQAQRDFDQGRLDEADARTRTVLAEDPGQGAALKLRAKIDTRARAAHRHAAPEDQGQPPGRAAVPRREHEDGLRGPRAPDRDQFHLRQGHQERRQDHDLRPGRAGRKGHRPGAGTEPARAPGAVRQHGDDLSEHAGQAGRVPGPGRAHVLPDEHRAEARDGNAEDHAEREDAVRRRACRRDRHP